MLIMDGCLALARLNGNSLDGIVDLEFKMVIEGDAIIGLETGVDNPEGLDHVVLG